MCFQFIDKGNIESVLLHECIRGSSVCFHLAFLISADKELTLCFKNIYPGINNLLRAYAVAVNIYNWMTKGKNLVRGVYKGKLTIAVNNLNRICLLYYILILKTDGIIHIWHNYWNSNRFDVRKRIYFSPCKKDKGSIVV